MFNKRRIGILISTILITFVLSYFISLNNINSKRLLSQNKGSSSLVNTKLTNASTSNVKTDSTKNNDVVGTYIVGIDDGYLAIFKVDKDKKRALVQSTDIDIKRFEGKYDLSQLQKGKVYNTIEEAQDEIYELGS